MIGTWLAQRGEGMGIDSGWYQVSNTSRDLGKRWLAPSGIRGTLTTKQSGLRWPRSGYLWAVILSGVLWNT